MSRSTEAAGALAFAAALLAGVAHAAYPGVGRAATPAEIGAWDIDVRPDFKGLPPGSGSVVQGQKIWDDKCASCHGTFGESNEVFTPLVGGTTAEDMSRGRVASLLRPDVGRTTLMKVSTVSSLWDYIRRAMPWNAPKSLTVDEVYAALAYLLNLGDIVPADFVLSDRNMAQVQELMPNRNGMVRAPGLWDVRGRPDVRNVACMKDCPTDAQVISALPEFARNAHGNLAEQNRAVGPVRGSGARIAQAEARATPAELAGRHGCLACHSADRRLVGPSFREVAARYHGQAGLEDTLVAKVRQGGGGAWGAVPMPPHAGLDAADLRALVRWVLDGAK